MNARRPVFDGNVDFGVFHGGLTAEKTARVGWSGLSGAVDSVLAVPEWLRRQADRGCNSGTGRRVHVVSQELSMAIKTQVKEEKSRTSGSVRVEHVRR